MESQDSAAVLVNVAALGDQSLTTSGDDIIVPAWASRLAGVLALGATISLGRITSPSLRQGTELDISPLNIGAEPLGPCPWHNLFSRPLELTPSEGLRAQVAEGAAGAELEVVIAWLLGEQEAAPDGEVQTIRCTGTATLVASAWSLVALTMGQQLEAGTYAIVGMRATSAGAIAARLVIPGSQYRPGCIAYDASSDVEDAAFRRGGLGKWGEFDHRSIPQVEFLSVSADTSEVVFLDVVKIK